MRYGSDVALGAVRERSSAYVGVGPLVPVAKVDEAPEFADKALENVVRRVVETPTCLDHGVKADATPPQ